MTSYANAIPRVDIFCRVIDNLGDVGVCWRLARQLVDEFDMDVQLIVDNLSPFATIEPDVDNTLAAQSVHGVNIRRWNDFHDACRADWVIEAFACDPPPAYVESMVKCAPPPFWVNLEYLSAEPWVDSTHGLPSPHPKLPLTKYFFVPGFTEKSGGLIRESWLEAKPLKAKAQSSVNCFAFTYPQAPAMALMLGFAQANSVLSFALAAPFQGPNTSLSAVTIPPVPQREFDTHLGTFDLLLVRGEDSFVRAQLAGKPMLWHVYPTDDRAHIKKLEAWLDRYCAGMDDALTHVYRQASLAFVDPRGDDSDIEAFRLLATRFRDLQSHAVDWRRNLFAMPDLAMRLIAFADRIRPRDED
jgi:hypothetical protein